MHRRISGGAYWIVAGVLAVSGVLLLAGRGGATPGPLCNTGQITKLADPSLSAPSPVYAGGTITSTGGTWTSCGESVSSFKYEWLRDGNVIVGPRSVAGAPGAFAYVVQAADVGHSIRSAVMPCNADGCYGAYAASSNAIVPAPTTAPPPPPPPPDVPPARMSLTFDEGFDYSITDEAGNVLSTQSQDGLPDGSYEISAYGGPASVYPEATAAAPLAMVTGAVSSFSLGVAGRRCYRVDKYRTAHDSITTRTVWRFHHVVRWCATYPAIDEGSLAVDSYFSNVDALFAVKWDDHGTGWWYTWRGSPTGGHYSRRQGEIDNCFFKWGCLFSAYPQIEIWVNGNGAWAAK